MLSGADATDDNTRVMNIFSFPCHQTTTRNMGWLRYFVAAIGAGFSVAHADVQPMLKYWWVMPEGGERGGEYTSAYNDSEVAALLKESALIEARVARQEALRQEALKLMRELRKQGKSALIAYEEAWTRVYSNRWLDAHWQTGSCKLEDMLTRLASVDTNQELTPEEQQWVLEALLEADDRLDSKLGRDLLRNLVSHLRALGYGKNGSVRSKRDLLMKQFADGLATGMDSRAAYREAMFKVNRDRIMCHTDTGYLAPWGVHVGDAPRYRQAPLIAATTLGSGSGYASGILEGFLAKSPADSGLEDDDEKKKDEEEDDELQAGGASAVAAAPMSGGSAPSRRSVLRALPPTRAAQLVWSGSASDEWTAAGDTSADSPWQNGASFANGSPVLFDDTGSAREVILTGVVAPGAITVSSSQANGKSGTTNVLNYGYAFNGSGSIADITDSTGKIIQATSISNTGSALLILDTPNTFSGGVSLAAGASLYIGCDGAAGTGTITMADKSTLIVNYQTDDLFFRAPSLSNSLKVNGNVEVTSGTVAYGEDRLTADWRTLTLSGGISGSGTLSLYGYSYMVKPTLREDREITLNYVSTIAVNEKNAAAGAAANRFSGTVYLKNEFNYQNSNTAEVPLFGNKSKHVAGALQLNLVDDVFAQAHLNLTRDDSPNRQAGENQGGDGRLGPSVTTDNILLLSENQKITIKSLDAAFLGHTFTYSYQNEQNQQSYKLVTSYREGYPQAYERWHVRVVTDGYTTLVLDDDSKTDHVFSGSMGFAHSYTTSSEAYIHAPNLSGKNSNSNVVEPNWTSGEWSLGLELLSLEKQGASAQYFHTANLQNLSVNEGVLGFNYLAVNGKLAVNAGSVLKLGVVASSDNPTDWVKTSASDSYDKDTIGKLTSSFTNTTLTVGSGQLDVSTASSQQAIVQGGLTLGTQAAGSRLSFDISGVMPSTTKSSTSTILDVQGALTLWESTLVNIGFSNINLSKYYDPKTTYYLASADSITINKDALNPNASFSGQFVSLGSGYYGKLSIVSGSGSDKHTYLALNVVGDPRRTWSGMVTGDYTWKTGESTKNKWKENCAYENGLLTLFGNLYQPVEWDGKKELDSYQTVHVLSGVKHVGTSITAEDTGFAIDDRSEAAIGFQKVQLQGKVLPAAVFIGTDYTLHSSAGDAGVSTDDDTNYYFYGDGYIGEAGASGDNVLGGTAFEGGSTSLRKMGYGTAVIATNNTFKGGTVLEGGRLVLQHYHALGTGGVTIFNGTTSQAERPNIPVLQGDFSDTDREAYEKAGGKSDPNGWVTRIGSGNVSAYDGEQMTTSTIHNPVTIILQTDSTSGGADTERVDARIANSHDRKMVLKQLTGPKGSIVSLYGTSVEATGAAGEQYTYAVFKVLDPKNFYGTIKMDGNLWGKPEGTDGGNVQMEIMTVDKSDNGADWLNTTVDLSIRNGTNRTVLALDAHGGADKPAEQIAQLDALHGQSADGSRINSSVVSMSHEKTVIFELEGLTSGDYDGVLGFGDFQKTVDYHSAQSSSLAEGTVAHHYGGVGKDGVLNVLKKGASVQSVYAAWLNQLSVEGGAFVADEALVVSDLKNAVGSHVVVGRTGDDALYGLTVTAGGILAIDQPSGDAFGKVGAGVAERWKEVVVGEHIELVAVPESSYVLFDDGATITGHSDWKTTREYGMMIEGHKEVFMNIASGATVTFNTHNYTPDETINSTNNKFGSYDRSYVIQLLGEMQGSGVHLVFNNELISEAEHIAGTATMRADGLGYTGATGTEMGYVGIRDIHQFTGDITVTDKTVLQVRDAYDVSANQVAEPELMAEVVDTLSVRVEGTDAAIQFTNDATMQYMEDVFMADGGQVLLGGAMKTTSGDGIKALDMTGVDAAVTHRTADEAHVNNLKLANSGTSVSMGGFDDIPSNATNARISTHGATTDLALNDMNLRGSLVQLHNSCSLNLKDAVLVDMNSVVRGAKVNEAALTVSPVADSSAADNTTTTSHTTTTSQATRVELTFSDNRGVYDVGNSKVLVLQTEQFLGVDVTGDGLTLQLTADSADFQKWAHALGAEYVAIQIGGGAGQFLYEDAAKTAGDAFDDLIDNQFVLLGADNQKLEGFWISSVTVQHETGANHVSTHMIYFRIPEPTTTTLSLMALTALCLRRRRK